MKHYVPASILLVFAIVAGTVTSVHSKGITMHRVNGSFDVKLQPIDPYNRDEGAGIARMSIDKQFHGALDATSKGEMLSAMGNVKGSAGYVAIERVSGTLAGRKGSFTLQHNATMTRGEPYLNIIIVPDSGSGDLVGLSGSMKIDITEGKHFYTFDYALAD